jgi:hypothetical protein
VTRTPTGRMPPDASDEAQLQGSTAQGRCIFAFNIRDFIHLARRYPHHGGIVLAAQRSMGLSELISALDRLLRETSDAAWPGQVRWLSDCRNAGCSPLNSILLAISLSCNTDLPFVVQWCGRNWR